MTSHHPFSTASLEEVIGSVRPGVSGLQLSINQLIWQYGPDTMTLIEADALARHIFGLIDNYNPAEAAEWFSDTGAHVSVAR